MTIEISFRPEDGRGTLAVSPEVPLAAWNRLFAAVRNEDPDCSAVDRVIDAEWSAILQSLPVLARLRKDYGVTTNYADETTYGHVRRFADQFAVVRRASASSHRSIQPEAIQGMLETMGFCRVLTPEQLRDAAMCAQLPNGANFSVPGAGKTTVALAVHLLTRVPEMVLLVVAPKNAFAAWDEVIRDCLDESAPERDRAPFIRLEGGGDAIELLLRENHGRMIVSYDQLIRVIPLIRRFMSTNPVHLILDESHRMKAGDRSQRGSALLHLSHMAVRRDILSGTPIPRSIEDIVPQVEFLWPGQGLGDRIRASSAPNETLRGLFVRTTKQELGLPPVTRHFHQVAMSDAQMALYSTIRSEVLKRGVGIRSAGNVDLAAARRSVMRLLQAASNPLLLVRRLTNESPVEYNYDDPVIGAMFSAIVEEGDSNKIREVATLARQLAHEGRKTVIWSMFRESVERTSALLSDVGATYIHGGVPTGVSDDPGTREGRIAHFHDDRECRILVANPAACSEGISLHRAAHDAIYLDRSFNAAHYLQSVDRIHRLGMDPDVETHVHVFESVAPHFVGAVDLSVRRRLIDKLRVMAEALDDQNLRQLALDEEEGDVPLDYDIDLDDLRDVIDELLGEAPEPGTEDFEF